MKNCIEEIEIEIEKEIEDTIIKLLLTRDTDKTICPSEVVRKLYPANWREKMYKVRKVAGNLVQENIIEITQKNKIVDIDVNGPIRLRLKNTVP
ncbi:MAG: DUF3253 domain-containing protein [Bdellovibrionales bacterium]|nr:DUF3253 domain-containing protein [Bdellovibrionales bacterium]